MNLKIKTKDLQDVLNKVVKGASCNKMLPLTSLVELNAQSTFNLTTTDGNNYLRCFAKEFEGNLIAVVDVTLLTSLVSKLTSTDVELEKTDKCLIVKGNGTYKIELPVDENGQEIKFPDPISGFVGNYSKEISEECYSKFIKSNKVALATSLAEPCYTGYYLGERVLTTDSYKICCNDYKLVDTPILINAECMKLVELMNGAITMGISDNTIIFSNANTIVYSVLMQGIENFNANAITNLVDTEFPHKAEINRASFLNLLDRITLFVSPFDKNNVTLHFTDSGLEVNSLQDTGIELIKYAYINDVVDYECDIDVVTLKQQISAQSGETIELWYGNDKSIKMVNGDTTQVVALSIE